MLYQNAYLGPVNISYTNSFVDRKYTFIFSGSLQLSTPRLDHGIGISAKLTKPHQIFVIRHSENKNVT